MRFFIAIALSTAAIQAQPGGADRILKLADQFVALQSTPAGRLPDHTPAAIARVREQQDRILAELNTIHPEDEARLTYVVLQERLQSAIALRACRSELWSVSHTQGWQNASLPAQSLPHFVDVEIQNLRTGLAKGYSAPKLVVQRVIAQLDAMPPQTALKNLRAFLAEEYLPKARNTLGISDLPNGKACYEALLRDYTTLNSSPQDVFEQGQRIVAASTKGVATIGQQLYGTRDFAATVARAKADPSNRFRSRDELLDYAARLLEEARAKSMNSFLKLPAQTVAIRPLPDYQDKSGVPSHYEARAADNQPAAFWIASADWANETRAAVAITTVHEAWPGHHVQIALARELQASRSLTRIASNAAYIEGWANYAERLAEESGIADSPNIRIQRRIILGRGLVLDTGIHFYGWTIDRAIEYAMEAGVSRQIAVDTIARIAAQPGQLTAYETGGFAILAFREEARAALGSRFDLREFHQRVIEKGPLPLTVLHDRIRAWAKPR